VDDRTLTRLPDATPAPEQPPTPRAAQTGDTDQPRCLGRFEIRRYLGEGVFGRVYEAYDPSLRRPVALKVAKPEQMSSPERVERFQREARAAATLVHPNIVAVFDSGQDGLHHYIVSTFVLGQSLEKQLLDGAGLPVRPAVELVRKLAEALAYAHRQGVVHRDVKPSNVLVRQDGEPLLADFGLATRGDEARLTQGEKAMGSPGYMAPEQWRGQAGPASDQYSLGCLLFELLSGHLPFAGADWQHLMFLHLNEPAPRLRQQRPDLPRELETICLKCLEKEPARRYADCQELADDLRRWLEGEPIRARPLGVAERLVRWALGEPRLAVAVGVDPEGRFAASSDRAAGLRAGAHRPRWRVAAGAAMLFLATVAAGWWLGQVSRQPSVPVAGRALDVRVSGSPVPVAQRALDVRVFRPETGISPLGAALPARSGDEFHVRCRVPPGLHVGLFSVNGQGRLSLLKPYPPQAAETWLEYPASNQTRELEAPTGTEVLLVCGRAAGPVSEAEMRAAWDDGEAWPELSPPQRLLRLSPSGVQEEWDRPRDWGKIRERPELNVVPRRLNQLRVRLGPTCPLLEGLAFAHQ
jgi:hypothetical protein